MQPPSVPNSELRKLYDECGGDLQQIADRLGISREALSAHLAPHPVYSPRRMTPPANIGRPELRKYVLSVRHAEASGWPDADLTKIIDARTKYEAGTHEMCQGRDGQWIIQYLIPRKKTCGARKFFRYEA